MATKPSLEELLQRVPEESLQKPCDDDLLRKVALKLSKWKSLAPYLGLSEVDEENIASSYTDVGAQRVKMLRTWRERLGQRATPQALAEAFWEVNRLDLIEEICMLLLQPADAQLGKY